MAGPPGSSLADPGVFLEPVHSAIYGLGFYRLSIIYNIGFVTARTIAEADGTQELAAYLKKLGYGFPRSYTQPPAYGTDPTWSEHTGVGEAL